MEQPNVTQKPQMSKFSQLHLQVQALPSRSSYSSHHQKESTHEPKAIPTESGQAQEEQESNPELRKTELERKIGSGRLWRSKSIQKAPLRIIEKKAIVRSDMHLDNTSTQMKSAPRRSITYHQGTSKLASKPQPLRAIQPTRNSLYRGSPEGQQSGGSNPRNSTLLANSVTNLENRSKRLLLLSVSGSTRKIDFLPSPKTESSVGKAALSGREVSASVSKPHQSTRFLPEQMLMGVFPLLATYRDKPSRNPVIFPRRVNFSGGPEFLFLDGR